ncbi:hypothetical protein F5Y19DRAFT_482730 [Xylariaceae sp. FL1651]|nr:hypothetical protein F5Y19DRAFT_482730 [Xylariaceae sp. FL1651]
MPGPRKININRDLRSYDEDEDYDTRYLAERPEPEERMKANRKDVQSTHDRGVPLEGKLKDNQVRWIVINGVESFHTVWLPPLSDFGDSDNEEAISKTVDPLSPHPEAGGLFAYRRPRNSLLGFHNRSCSSAITRDGEYINIDLCAFSSAELHRFFKTLFTIHPTLSRARKVVGLACVSLAYGPEVGSYSAAQHALLLSLRDFMVRNSRSEHVQCFAQDPVLSLAATEALEAIGVAVLEDPNAFLEIDDTTFVVSISPNIAVKQIVVDIARPAAILWDGGSDTHTGRRLMTNPSSPRVERMLEEGYVEMAFSFDEGLRGAKLISEKSDEITSTKALPLGQNSLVTMVLEALSETLSYFYWLP